ncbi:MAG: MmcB family DNA repair protein, partial [Pseudomonadota bacterium]
MIIENGQAHDRHTEGQAHSPSTSRAAAILRGVYRLFIDQGLAPVAEFSLPNGRRVDVAALDERGMFVFVEIKSCLNDFRTDRKWHTYR